MNKKKENKTILCEIYCTINTIDIYVNDCNFLLKKPVTFSD